jgi:hypothetical protein
MGAGGFSCYFFSIGHQTAGSGSGFTRRLDPDPATINMDPHYWRATTATESLSAPLLQDERNKTGAFLVRASPVVHDCLLLSVLATRY